MALDQAQSANALFLGVVAIWRVALYVNFLRKGAGLKGLSAFTATVLPLSAIIVALAFLNLEHAAFELMAGIEESDETQNDIAYVVVLVLSLLAYVLFPLTLIFYAVGIYRARKRVEK